MDILDVFFLPAVFYIGIVASYEDFRAGKIRNKIILYGLIYGLAVLGLLFIWTLFAESLSEMIYTNILKLQPDDLRPVITIRLDFFWKTIVNSFLALVVGFSMWKFRFLAAGDAKLFFLFSLLLPIKYYWRSYLPFFPAFALLVNIFLSIFLGLTLKALIFKINYFFRHFYGATKIKKKLRQNIDKKTIEKKFKEKARVILLFVVLLQGLGYAKGFLTELLNLDFSILQSCIIVIMILFSSKISAILKDKRVLAGLALIFLGLTLIGFQQDFSGTIHLVARLIFKMTIFMFVFEIFSKLLDDYTRKTGEIKSKIEDLQVGARLSEKTIEDLKTDKVIFHNYRGRLLPRGLNKNEVKTIKQWARKTKRKEIGIYCHFPFAFWIFIGVMLTIIFKGSVVNIIIYFLKY